jgi:hypothetical protein
MLQLCSRRRHSPHTKFFNASTSTTVHFHLVREKTSNVVWNSSSTNFDRFGLEMNIGQGASPSKTECVFFPPPQFFQHAPQHRNTTATLIQRAFRHAHTSTHPHQLIEQPAPSSTSPRISLLAAALLSHRPTPHTQAKEEQYAN